MHGGMTGRMQFGRFEIDRHNLQLLHDGQRIPIEPKALACLEYLVAHAGQLVRSTQLQRALWPDVHVAAGALRRVVNAVRQALRVDSEARGWIETRRGVGYTFRRACEPPATLAAGGEQLAALPAWPFVGRAQELASALDWLSKVGHDGGLCWVVAVARHPEAVPPIAGSYLGPEEPRPSMLVSVQVHAP